MAQLLQGVAGTKVYAQMDLPQGCAVAWYASNDNGATWVALAEEPGTRRAVNSVWTEYTLAGAFADGTKKQVRYKAIMTGSGARFQPCPTACRVVLGSVHKKGKRGAPATRRGAAMTIKSRCWTIWAEKSAWARALSGESRATNKAIKPAPKAATCQ